MLQGGDGTARLRAWTVGAPGLPDFSPEHRTPQQPIKVNTGTTRATEIERHWQCVEKAGAAARAARVPWPLRLS